MKGLTTQEVNERKKMGLVNNTRIKTSRSYADIIYRNLVTPFNIILLVVGLALALLQNYISALSATGLILLNIFISTIQEMRAKRRLDKIALLVRPKVTVVRDGEETIIDQYDIVKDDLIIIRAGEQAVVDGILEQCTSLEMDEAMLTGESSTVRKEKDDKIYSGSICITGEGYFTVTAFGADSYSSQILASAKKFNSKKTPLQMETNTITTFIVGIAFLLLAASIVKEFIAGDNLSEVLEVFVICLDVVPVALFLLITLTYMIAAIRMSDTGVLLQRYSSVESISHVDVVCMDKTGTITTNNLVFDSAKYLVDEEEAKEMIRLFANSTGSKNKTVKTLISEYGETDFELLEEIQFSSARKFSAVKVKHSGKVYTLYSGAWNVISEHIQSAGEIDSIISEESSKGMRTLVICTSEDEPLFVDNEPVIHDLKAIAVISIKDEVRADCRETIDVFLENGMDLKVISGDDPVTVDALFSIANLPGERKMISGPELEKLSGKELEDAVLETNIFGRMKPDDKETVVEVLKRSGKYVAMIGDGVNDVKSLKSAQVGVALESGSGAARGVSDMILVEDDFSALPKAIVEGRRTVSGIRDILKIYLSRNFTLAILIVGIFFIVGNIPMLPIQNMFYAVVAVSFIAFFMTIFAKPERNDELILPDVLRFCIPSAIIIGILGLLVYVFALSIPWESFDISYLKDQEGTFGKTVQEIIDTFLKWKDTDSMNEIAARTTMLLFVSITGALQIFIVCPRFKFMSVNGKTNKSLLPIFLVGLVLLAVLVLHLFVPQLMTVIGLIYLPTELYVFIAAMVFVALALILIVYKKGVMRALVDRFERYYIDKLQKEYTKGSDENH